MLHFVLPVASLHPISISDEPVSYMEVRERMSDKGSRGRQGEKENVIRGSVIMVSMCDLAGLVILYHYHLL